MKKSTLSPYSFTNKFSDAVAREELFTATVTITAISVLLDSLANVANSPVASGSYQLWAEHGYIFAGILGSLGIVRTLKKSLQTAPHDAVFPPEQSL